MGEYESDAWNKDRPRTRYQIVGDGIGAYLHFPDVKAYARPYDDSMSVDQLLDLSEAMFELRAVHARAVERAIAGGRVVDYESRVVKK